MNGVVPVAHACAETWRRLTGGNMEVMLRLRLHVLRAVIPPPTPPGCLRQATADDLDCVHRWYMEFHDEATPADPLPQREQIAASIDEGSVYL